MSQLAFGSVPGLGAGNACGRCFEITGDYDPYDPSFTGPFNKIVVKDTDMCPVQGNEQWCGQTTKNPVNSYNASVQYVVLLLSLVCESACSARFIVALTCVMTRVPLTSSSHPGTVHC